jgi:hypothetical protein
MRNSGIPGAESVVFEVAGSRHSPRLVGNEDTIVFVVIAGALDFVDDPGNTLATENRQTFLKRYHDYCGEKGLTPVDFAKF